MHIRLTTPDDIAPLRAILDRMDMFPSDMLPDMIAPFLAEGEAAGLWVTAEAAGAVTGFCYSEPEKLTDGTWNMLAIAVDPERQGAGCGTAMTRFVENRLANLGQRLLIVDTSGTDAFAATRAFYRKNSYREEARIRDFWAEGDDKVTLSKTLQEKRA